MLFIACHTFILAFECEMGAQAGKTTNASGTAHCVGHLLVTAQRLNAQSDRLQLRAHLVELLDVSAGTDQILRHDLACVLRAL
jgi:hypothetical protein